MKKIYKYLLLLTVGLIPLSCNDLLEDQLTDPNNVSTEQLDINLLTNQVLYGFARFYSEASEPGMELTRMIWGTTAGGDIYERIYQPQSFNTLWDRAYIDCLNQANFLESEATERGFTAHMGVAKVIKAFTYITLVDMFGDIPFSEAVAAESGNFNPNVQDGASVYQASIDMLNDAISDLGETPPQAIQRDIYYGGNRTKWAALARTLILKSLVNIGASNPESVRSQIEQALAQDIIDTDAEEFIYQYGTANIPLSSKHWIYVRMYPPSGTADGYIANDFMFKAYAGKSAPDPRWRYYFYRQVGSLDRAIDLDPQSIPCILSPKPTHYDADVPFCAFEPGFYGRDMGNNDGIPPDGEALTVAGVYPFGGRPDLNNGDSKYNQIARNGQGANGAGLEPIWMASFTDFLKAEIALTYGIGDAKASMLSGVQKSIERVQAFGASRNQAVPEEMVTPTEDYLVEVESKFDAENADQLNILATEFWLALFGNGVESYNMYRRTGKPGNIQPMRTANPGIFWRSLLYPADHTALNSNATQKDVRALNRVFWDTKDADFVK